MNVTEDKGKFRIDFKILSILLLLAAIPVLLGSWWLFKGYESAYLEMAGNNLSESADTALAYINSYLQNQIIVVAGLTEVPVVREAVKKGNLVLGKNLEEVRKAIPAMENRWPKLERNSPELKAILDNEASKFLRRYGATEKSFREIMVTDYLGRLVAATGKTSDYYQADEDWWRESCSPDPCQRNRYFRSGIFDSRPGHISWHAGDPERAGKGKTVFYLLCLCALHLRVTRFQDPEQLPRVVSPSELDAGCHGDGEGDVGTAPLASPLFCRLGCGNYCADRSGRADSFASGDKAGARAGPSPRKALACD